MDVERQTNHPGERMSECRSLSSNHRYCSQSRKMSIGVLVDSTPMVGKKNVKEPAMQIAENQGYSKENCVKDGEGRTPLVEKHMTVKQKETSPWVSTRSLNPKRSSSVAVQDSEHTPSFPATSRRRPRSKLIEKASAAHSPKFFAAKTGLEHDECRQKNSGKDTCFMEAVKVNNAEHVESLVNSTEPGVRLEKELVEDKDRTTETWGRETLRMKLWEVLGNVSSPNKHFPSSKFLELHPDQERDGQQSPIEKINPNSDTIESDSQAHTLRRSKTHSVTRRKPSSKKQSSKIDNAKPIHRKECPQKRIFSSRRDWSGRVYDNLNDGSLPSKRNKILTISSGVETHQGCKNEGAEERRQSEKSRSIPAVEKLIVHEDKFFNGNSSSYRGNDILQPKERTENNNSFESPLIVMTDQKDIWKPIDVEVSKNWNKVFNASISSDKRNDELKPKKCTKNNTYFESLLNMTDQKDVQQPIDVQDPKNNQQEDISNSSLKSKRNSINDPSTPPSQIKSWGHLPKSKQGKLHDQSPAEKIFNTTGIRSFKCLLSSRSSERKPNLQPSDGGCDSPNNILPVKPSIIMDEDGENWMSKLSTDETDSESSEDESHMKGCKESEALSPGICKSENFLCSPNKSPGNNKDVEVTGCSPRSDSLAGNQDNSELEEYLEQNPEDGLARAVALFTVALDRVKNKLKAISSRRSAEILQAAVEEIFLRLQNAESVIKTDMEKMANLSQSKRKQLETRFQDRQEQLHGIYRKFREEVDRHLQDCGSLFEVLDEHKIELKRSVERRRATHKKIISQVEREINAQLDDAESRIMAVKELATEKLLQLKLGLADCLRHGTFD